MARVLLLILTMFCNATAFAEACTYQEALMAQENGHFKRAQTLMQMAARDGDQRAITYLKRNSDTSEIKLISIASADSGKVFISLP